jgi:molybdate transport system regulatory protein
MMEKDNPVEWRLRSKVWIEVEGRPVMGEGRMAMLQAIHRCGSIIDASRETGISYRKMRGAVRDMETAVGRPLVKVFRGGGDGGGAMLTTEAHALMDAFRKFAAGLQQEAKVRFQNSFKPSSGTEWQNPPLAGK